VTGAIILRHSLLQGLDCPLIEFYGSEIEFGVVSFRGNLYQRNFGIEGAPMIDFKFRTPPKSGNGFCQILFSLVAQSGQPVKFGLFFETRPAKVTKVLLGELNELVSRLHEFCIVHLFPNMKGAF
jgi:hypothetical protein